MKKEFVWSSHHRCLQEVACTAGNLNSMLLTKDAALAMFAFELQLEGMSC